VARQVLAGRYEAGALKDVVARHYLSGGLRIIHTSRPIPSMPVTVRPDLPDSVAAALVRALVALGPGDLLEAAGGGGREAEYRYGFAPASDADYEALRHTLSAIPGGCARGCHQERTF